MREEKLLGLLIPVLGACVPTTTGTGKGEAHQTESSQAGTEGSTGDGDDHAGETDSDTGAEPAPEEDFADAMHTLTYGQAGPSKIVIHAFAKDATTVAKIWLFVEEKAVDPVLLVSAEFPDTDGKWLLHDEEVTSAVSSDDAPTIRARAQVIRDAIQGQSMLAHCAARIAETVVDCAAEPQPQICKPTFTLAYCECRFFILEVANIACE